MTLAINVADREAVDTSTLPWRQALGRRCAVDREWGGYSGYVADPEGTRWEIAWLPGYR